ncbi:respiratory nitrate reductase chaperone NarJ [Stackebrandtia albiflava]|uniref:Respiratory nitrate reductase chaperone NarJ n=1 Tax=Stackebrandtia albiflava TaxID=406432 RepID=A0A562VBM8_9ACTN|nr:nitrate reductase molybdenum cofactor assembly chaperone [Stackebrandtia albiflava]TWJ15286.1 respiratory nitrate reductase chaperone NarJ [Stackebrandtia albiflava]
MSADAGVIRHAAGMLLAYPDRAARDRLPLVAAALAEQPRSRVRTDLIRFTEELAAADPSAAAAEYVETFDLRRRRSLHLTYYSDGDTRRRGGALAAVKGVIREAGWVPPVDELPDHLAVLCEFAARDPDRGVRLLVELRPGLELLREALREAGSRYLVVVDAVRGTLPAGDATLAERVRRLAGEGPARESVGLSGYGGAVPLGMPTTARGGAR